MGEAGEGDYYTTMCCWMVSYFCLSRSVMGFQFWPFRKMELLNGEKICHFLSKTIIIVNVVIFRRKFKNKNMLFTSGLRWGAN